MTRYCRPNLRPATQQYTARNAQDRTSHTVADLMWSTGRDGQASCGERRVNRSYKRRTRSIDERYHKIYDFDVTSRYLNKYELSYLPAKGPMYHERRVNFQISTPSQSPFSQ